MATQAEVAEHLDLTERQLRRLQALPGAPKPKKRGELDKDEWRVFYIRHIRYRGERPGSDNAEDDSNDDTRLLAARIRLTEAQAIAQELKNLKDDRHVVDTTFCTFALSRLANDIGSILDGIPLKMQRRFTDMDKIQIEYLKLQVAKTMNLAVRTCEKLPEILDEYIDSAGQ